MSNSLPDVPQFENFTRQTKKHMQDIAIPYGDTIAFYNRNGNPDSFESILKTFLEKVAIILFNWDDRQGMLIDAKKFHDDSQPAMVKLWSFFYDETKEFDLERRASFNAHILQLAASSFAELCYGSRSYASVKVAALKQRAEVALNEFSASYFASQMSVPKRELTAMNESTGLFESPESLEEFEYEVAPILAKLITHYQRMYLDDDSALESLAEDLTQEFQDLERQGFFTVDFTEGRFGKLFSLILRYHNSRRTIDTAANSVKLFAVVTNALNKIPAVTSFYKAPEQLTSQVFNNDNRHLLDDAYGLVNSYPFIHLAYYQCLLAITTHYAPKSERDFAPEGKEFVGDFILFMRGRDNFKLPPYFQKLRKYINAVTASKDSEFVAAVEYALTDMMFRHYCEVASDDILHTGKDESEQMYRELRQELSSEPKSGNEAIGDTTEVSGQIPATNSADLRQAVIENVYLHRLEGHFEHIDEFLSVIIWDLNGETEKIAGLIDRIIKGHYDPRTQRSQMSFHNFLHNSGVLQNPESTQILTMYLMARAEELLAVSEAVDKKALMREWLAASESSIAIGYAYLHQYPALVRSISNALDTSGMKWESEEEFLDVATDYILKFGQLLITNTTSSTDPVLQKALDNIRECINNYPQYNFAIEAGAINLLITFLASRYTDSEPKAKSINSRHILKQHLIGFAYEA